MNFKTVISFGQKNIDYLIEKYKFLLLEPYKKNTRKAYFLGLLMGYSNLIRFLYIGIIYFIASKLIVQYDLDSQSVFIGVYVIFVGAIGSGTALS